MRIGIDVGGTHTDAVLLKQDEIIASNKSLTSEDVATGIIESLQKVMQEAQVSTCDIKAIMMGTTQFTNAVVERRHLSRIAVVRFAKPSGLGCPPLVDWPDDLYQAISPLIHSCHGGFLYDAHPLSELQQGEINAVIDDISKHNIKAVAVSSAFSTMDPSHELMFSEQLQSKLPDCKVSMSHQIGSLGLLERENAAILNAALLPFAEKVVAAFTQSLKQLGFTCPFFVSQNDGTLMSADFVRKFPALTFASGPTNSLRGAYKLSGEKNAIVVDIGGTTSDIGVLQNGFPRESKRIVKVGGVRTNFRMPDIQAIGLGGGSLIKNHGKTIGPESCGHKLVNEGLIFGGNTLTASDIAVANGNVMMGSPNRVKNLDKNLVQQAINTIHSMLNDSIEMMKSSSAPVPVILVGGGACLIEGELDCAAKIIRCKNSDVANAVGAAIAQIGAEAESMLCYNSQTRQAAIDKVSEQASLRAIEAGACKNTIRIVEIEETDVPYMNDDMMKIRVKVIADIALEHEQ